MVIKLPGKSLGSALSSFFWLSNIHGEEDIYSVIHIHNWDKKRTFAKSWLINLNSRNKINVGNFKALPNLSMQILFLLIKQQFKTAYSLRNNCLALSVSKSQRALTNRAPSSEFVSSNIPSWQILTAHAQPFRGARDLAFWLKVPLDSLLVWASSEGSGETARMRRLAWTYAARIGDKYQIRLTRSNKH